MPAPRVFVSSTFYDLKYIRENLEYFIRSLGYEPVLSERGAVYYNPNTDVQEAAVDDVVSCQMLVLIIGGRFGQEYKDDPQQSVTNAEYKRAVKEKIPIFALVERDVYGQYFVFLENREHGAVDAASIKYPAVDSVKIFDFIEEVQAQAINNALVPFADFEEIQSYLRQQWASMMFAFLTSESEAGRVADMLGAVTEVSRKVEFLTSEVLRSVGDPAGKAAAELYDCIVAHEHMPDLARGGARPTPEAILRSDTVRKYFRAAKVNLKLGTSLRGASWRKGELNLGKQNYQETKSAYDQIREQLLQKLDEYGLSVEEYLDRKMSK